MFSRKPSAARPTSKSASLHDPLHAINEKSLPTYLPIMALKTANTSTNAPPNVLNIR